MYIAILLSGRGSVISLWEKYRATIRFQSFCFNHFIVTFLFLFFNRILYHYFLQSYFTFLFRFFHFCFIGIVFKFLFFLQFEFYTFVLAIVSILFYFFTYTYFASVKILILYFCFSIFISTVLLLFSSLHFILAFCLYSYFFLLLTYGICSFSVRQRAIKSPLNCHIIWVLGRLLNCCGRQHTPYPNTIRGTRGYKSGQHIQYNFMHQANGEQNATNRDIKGDICTLGTM